MQIVPEGANELPDTLTDSGWGYGNAAMVEAYIAGRELTCAVLDDAPTDVMEIVPTNGFYDYRAKYDEGRRTKVPSLSSASTTIQSPEPSRALVP